MTGVLRALGTCLLRLALLTFPQRLRRRYGNDPVDLFCHRLEERIRRRGVVSGVVFIAANAMDTLWAGLRARSDERRLPSSHGSPALDSLLLENVFADLRLALRRIGKTPGFAALTVVTLSLGIGATTAIFSVVRGVLLQPLPYDEAENLVYMNTYYLPETGLDFPEYYVGSPEYFDYKNTNRSMEAVAAVWTETVTVRSEQSDPEVLLAGRVSPSMFTVLRAPPFLGRTLVESDGGAQPAAVAVISHDLWQRRFGGDSAVIGQRLGVGTRASDAPSESDYEVVGVMPAGFSYPGEGIQLWVPGLLDPGRRWREGHWFTMIGRLAQGVRFEEADSELKTMMAQWAEAYPDHHQGHGLFMEPLLDHEVGEARPALLLLLGTVIFVLLIACANVASLLLARGEGRRREIAVRGALGARRGRILQEALTESFLLALLGGFLGLLLAWGGVRALLVLEPGNLPRLEGIGVDGGVLGFVAAAVLATTLVFGLLPALQEARYKAGDALREASFRATTGARRMRLRRGIVVAEVALSVLLLVGAGLMVRSLRNLLTEDAGFDGDNLLFADFTLPGSDYSAEEAISFYDRLVREVRDLPGVREASIITRVPLLERYQLDEFHIEGRVRRSNDRDLCCVGTLVFAGEGLFQTMGIPLVRGRYLTAEDQLPDARPVALVDEAAVDRYWPDEDPIGTRITMGGDWMEVVGVVGSVTFDGPGLEWPTVYMRTREFILAVYSQSLVVRTAAEPGGMVEGIRRVVRSIDSRQAVARMLTTDQIESRALARPSFILTLMGLFAATAMFLGGIGIYGVISHGVALRKGEIGIRRAVGARKGAVLSMILKQGLALTGTGLALGLAGALICSRLLGGFLHEVSPTDPLTFALVAGGVITAAALASFFPARRASGIDPMGALRME